MDDAAIRPPSPDASTSITEGDAAPGTAGDDASTLSTGDDASTLSTGADASTSIIEGDASPRISDDDAATRIADGRGVPAGEATTAAGEATAAADGPHVPHPGTMTAAAGQGAPPHEGAVAVDALADRFWEGFLERHPTLADRFGDPRWSDRLEDPGPDGRAADRGALEALLGEAEAIDPAGLPVEAAITRDMLITLARLWLRAEEQHLYELDPVDAMGGPQTLPGNLARIQRVDSPERFEALLQRLSAYPAYMAAWEAVMREGAASRMTAARPTVERVQSQLERMVAAPIEESPLLVGLRDRLTPDQVDRLRATVERHVRPPLAAFLEAVRAYAPQARSADGLWSVPDGRAAYATSVLYATSLAADPQELHDYGLAQLEAIDAERLAVARDLGQPDVAALRQALADDPAQRTSDREAFVAVAEGHIARALAAAPRAFGRLPRADCEVRPVEPYMEREAPPAFYVEPPPDGSRPGIFFLNAYRCEERPLYRLADTTFHEATPGHHFQLATQTELSGLPAFRTQGALLVSVAFAEGWGLYAERLADELGLYASPAERLGMLDAQAWRACRLVVDTGIHAFGWDRQRSIDLLVERAALPRLEAETETDRYISWPGQALAYMSGQREIRALRRELEARDGSRFDLRAFHDAVIGHGSLPLATLRAQLPGWVQPAA
ncbi:MAG TPA: DUF885 domain-containing protein [Candidatus Limnocylindrales bacterium]|nr:DUF885 domain-containing protein [Candidatus Limnocylindrales bacterium]